MTDKLRELVAKWRARQAETSPLSVCCCGVVCADELEAALASQPSGLQETSVVLDAKATEAKAIELAACPDALRIKQALEKWWLSGQAASDLRAKLEALRDDMEAKYKHASDYSSAGLLRWYADKVRAILDGKG